MINIYLPSGEKQFNLDWAIMTNKRFFKPKVNSILKYDVVLIRIGMTIYALEKPTIIVGVEESNVIVEGRMQETKTGVVDHEFVRKIKKIRNHYRNKFRFGLTYDKLDTYFDSEIALKKYKMLYRKSLIIKEVKHV